MAVACFHDDFLADATRTVRPVGLGAKGRAQSISFTSYSLLQASNAAYKKCMFSFIDLRVHLRAYDTVMAIPPCPGSRQGAGQWQLSQATLLGLQMEK